MSKFATTAKVGWTMKHVRDIGVKLTMPVFFAEPLFEPELKHIEERPSVIVTFHDSPQGLATRERSKRLYSILAGILKNRPLKVLRQVTEANGLEVWRQLNCLYTPRTKGRSLALLNAIMSYPSFSKDRSTLEQVQNLERVADEYRRSSGRDISDDILLSTLVRVLPRDVQRHAQLTMSETSTYAEIREQVIAHEGIAYSWSRDRVLADVGAGPVGAVTSYATGDGGTAPMEINMVKGKGKQKGKNNKGKGKGKPVFRKAKARANHQIRAKARATAVARAMAMAPRIPQRTPMLERSTTTVVPIVANQVTGRRTAIRGRLTCRLDKLKRVILRTL